MHLKFTATSSYFLFILHSLFFENELSLPTLRLAVKMLNHGLGLEMT